MTEVDTFRNFTTPQETAMGIMGYFITKSTVISFFSSDRCQLQEPEKIQKLQDKFVECLQYHLTKTVSNPGRRLSQIFDRMLAIRDLTHQNNQANKKFLSEWGFVMQDFPLWKEMLSFDEV